MGYTEMSFEVKDRLRDIALVPGEKHDAGFPRLPSRTPHIVLWHFCTYSIHRPGDISLPALLDLDSYGEERFAEICDKA